MPAEYTDVTEVSLVRECYAPETLGDVKTQSDALLTSRRRENEWLSNVEVLRAKESLSAKDYISWAVFHASKQQVERPVCSMAVLPLFTEKAQSASMILHVMNLIRQAVQRFNPQQIPVITADMPLYAICKQIQWQWPQTHGEEKYVAMLEGLHIEMNILKLLEDWLNGSGWKTALVQAGVTTCERADAISNGSQVTRARYAHQVTAAVLHLLQRAAFDDYIQLQDEAETPLSFMSWHQKMFSGKPQFAIWSLTLYLEILYLQFVRSLRSTDIKLYVQCLGEFAPWMFALNHSNYARWLPVHIRDMVQLPTKAASTYAEFKKGHFVVAEYWACLFRHGHGPSPWTSQWVDDGIVGLTDNPTALLRWITAGPEVQRILHEFENSFKSTNEKPKLQDHDQTASFPRGRPQGRKFV